MLSRVVKVARLQSAVFVIAISTLSAWFLPQAANGQADPNRPIKDKWAVVIGIGDFSSPTIPKLKYPAKDAQDFYNFLTSSGNFKKDHVLLLKDKDASKDAILDAFGGNWLPRRVMEDDLVVMFLSTHGSPSDTAGENFIVAYDTDPKRLYATGIRFQDLAEEVTRRTGCDRLVMFLDACHSGAAVTGRKGMERVTNFNLDQITGKGQLVISSSSPAESSWESKRYQNGVFTRKLIEAMQVNGAKTNVNQAYESLRDGVEQEVRFDRATSQTPMLLSKWEGRDLSLCAQPTSPRTLPPELAEDLGSASSPDVVRPVVPHIVPRQTQTVATTTRTVVAATPPPVSGISTLTSHMGTTHLPFMSTSWTSPNGDSTLEAGTREIQEFELSGLSKQELEYLYNEAYARHGRGFMTKNIQDHFNAQSWYKIDPDYHYSPKDPVVIKHKAPDDMYVVNEKRTPKQWANMMTIKRLMSRR